jgi:hypothetical protein
VHADEKLSRFWNWNLRSALAANSLDKLARFFRDSPDMKTSIPPVLITFALVCFALSPMLQAQNQNTRFGTQALDSNTTGDKNTAIGHRAMYDNTAGSENTATGFQALANNTEGGFNTATGGSALRYNTTGSLNTAMGQNALNLNNHGSRNTATGNGALSGNTGGNNNTATGYIALNHNTAGINNTAIGAGALFGITVGNHNIALGNRAGENLTTGDQNIYIGNLGDLTESKTIRIGTKGTHTNTFIAGIRGVTVVGGAAVFVNENGQLGTLPSSQRFKDEIKPMDKASEAILALKPVTFRYKKEIAPEGIPQFGLVAEDVEKVNPDLVVRDEKGQIYSVRYEAVNAMLLNEFLKEHRTVQDLESTVAKQEATIAQQQTSFQSKLAEQERQIEALTAGLQKVSAQLELNKPAPQTVLNNR